MKQPGDSMGRFVILTGPSCVGKGPLCEALGKFYPEAWAKLREFILYNDRAPRPGERDGVDYHFRPRAEIERMRGKKDVLVMEVRGDLQAADLGELRRLLAGGDAFFEGNPFVARALKDAAGAAGAATLSVFMSPLSREEIAELRSRGIPIEPFVAEVMRRKLLRRMTLQRGALGPKDLAELERRSGSAFVELHLARLFDLVLPNHDGEGSENWDVLGYPVADARRSLLAFVDLLEGRIPACLERWTAGNPL